MTAPELAAPTSAGRDAGGDGGPSRLCRARSDHLNQDALA